jgi:SHS2 domain-containing protein
MMAQLEQNLEAAYLTTADLIAFLKTKGEKSPIANLRINEFDCFDILVRINSDLYYSDTLIDIYRKIADIENSSNGLKIHYSLMGNDERVNAAAIESDGYLLTYKHNEKKARKT